jgi:GT2 family glycosyltransferase
VKTLSFILPTLNGAQLIGACLRSLEPQLQPGDEIIAVDNGSTDGTPELIERDFPQVRLMRMGRNLGYGGGANCGIGAARGGAAVILNQDMTFPDGCFAALRQRLEAIGPCILGAKLLYPDGKTIQHAGGIMAYPRAIPSHHGYQQIDDGRWDELNEPDYVTGALFVIDRAVIDAIGLFDEAFFPAYYEEVDYCYRARRAGFRVIYDPQAVAIHYETQTYDRRSTVYHQAMLRGRLRFVLKNYTPDQLLNDFFPAEQDHLQSLPDDAARAIYAPAYLSVLLNLPRITPREALGAIIQQLSTLHNAALRLETPRVKTPPMEVPHLPRIKEMIMSETPAPIRLPALHEHDFRSDVAVVGPLIQAARRAIYNLTARWGVMAVIQQQDHVNAVIAQHLNEQAAHLRQHEAHLRQHEAHLRQYEAHLRQYEAQLRQHDAQLAEYHTQLIEFDDRLIDQDRDLARFSHITAETELRQRYLARRLSADTRLDAQA